MGPEYWCENIDDLQDSEIEIEAEETKFEEEEIVTSNWDIQKIEAAEYENCLVASGYYQRMRYLNG